MYTFRIIFTHTFLKYNLLFLTNEIIFCINKLKQNEKKNVVKFHITAP